MGFFEIFAAIKEWDNGPLVSKFFLAAGLWLMIRRELGKDKVATKREIAFVMEELNKIKAHVGLETKEK